MKNNMNYIPSINIETTPFNSKEYIITPNTRGVAGSIVDAFNTGIHSFNIIGSYGTGKSNFILALEDSLVNGSGILLPNKGQFNSCTKYKFVKIVGDYTSLHKLLTSHLFATKNTDNLFENLLSYCEEADRNGEFVFFVIDEFGKQLEYAAKNNPERELYLLQQFAEFINNSHRNAILLTTLHQNFNSYARSLSESQRNEWTKVKGRFKEIVFNEPVEQLLYLAAKRIELSPRKELNNGFMRLFDLAQTTKFASKSIDYATAKSLYPMDLLAAQAMALSIQRYGQNERTLFSFLEANGVGSLKAFQESKHTTFSLSDVYDYDIYNFHSYLSEANADTSVWTSIRVSIERAEGLFDGNIVKTAISIIKTIGMINLFGNAGVKWDLQDLSIYSKNALGIENPEEVIKLLSQHKIIRYATYKSQYILFEGTDVNIEGELLKASSIVPRSRDIIEKIISNFNLPIEFANAVYYLKGTPRYFEYCISDAPITRVPQDEIDGYINLIFNETVSLDMLKDTSSNTGEAIIFAYFKNASTIIDHIWQLDKLAYVQNIVDSQDYVAHKEISSLIAYEQSQLNDNVLNVLFNGKDDVVWIYHGRELNIASKTDFNKQLSIICDDVYYSTPVFINEMVNKHKPSGAMATARVNYLTRLLDNSSEPNLGFEQDKFPPEKTIFLTLLHNTGIYRNRFGAYELMAPNDNSFMALWNACEDFFEASKEKPRKLAELIKVLSSRPLKLKQGVIDLWIPTYLIIKKNDYSLYDDNDVYIPAINREVLDILQKSPKGFSIKAFSVDGVKLDLFNKYREALSLSYDDEFTADSLIETIKPFLIFYKKLNKYAQHTKRLKKTTLQFRHALATAKDPEKTFFEDLPQALGFKNIDISANSDVLMRYVELLQMAIRELRSCYVGLIERLEKSIIDALGLNTTDYNVYKPILEQRYSCVKKYLLTDRQKTFLTRVLAPATDRKMWYQSLAYVVLDKQLESILDEEEAYLVDNMVHIFRELDKYVDISNKNFESSNDFYRFELISKDGAIEPTMLQLTEKKVQKAKNIENQIDELLSGDNDIDTYALLSIIKKKLSNE